MTIPLFERAQRNGERTAIVADSHLYSYRQLLQQSGQAAAALLQLVDKPDLQEARIAFLTPRGFDYVAAQWGIWRAGGLAVPLCEAHPQPELAYVLDDADVSAVVAHPEFADKLRPLAAARQLPLILTSTLYETTAGNLPDLTLERRAMMLYTSGTTGRPKGVVSTHGNIQAQATTLVSAWGWTADDYIINILPLHHVHGIINILTCALWVGATCEIRAKFDTAEVWSRLASGDLTLFMAVPTIYARLIQAWEAAPPEQQAAMSAGCARLRLMVSGSAALPVSTLQKWQQISNHTLLERYGMTEIGMALSNPLNGLRKPGFVGQPLPGVEIRLVDENGQVVEPGLPGEIQVKGPAVFREYFRRPDATIQAFREGWFCTGDTAVFEDGAYRILGRNSVDIIKTGGYKVSALEIEEVLRTHPAIQECAVVGVEDPVWGERVCAAIIPVTDELLSLEALRDWARERLAPYKLPSRLTMLDDLPRNTMGKVTKPQVAALFQANNQDD